MNPHVPKNQNANRLHVWQVVAPAHVDQVDFWEAVTRHVIGRHVPYQTALFVLRDLLFPRALSVLSKHATTHWKVPWTFSETDRVTIWKTLVHKGAPPHVAILVLDHVIPSMLSSETLRHVEALSPDLKAIIFRTERELPLNDQYLASSDDVHHVLMVRPPEVGMRGTMSTI